MAGPPDTDGPQGGHEPPSGGAGGWRAEPEDAMSLLLAAAKLGRVAGWAVHLPGWEIYWSDHLFEMLEWPEPVVAEVGSALDLYLPEYRAGIAEALERCAAFGEPFDIDAEMRTTSGRALSVRIVGAADRDATGRIVRLSGAFQDVTEQRGAARRLAESEERFRHIARATADAVWDWDLVTDEVWWSAGIETLFGHRPDALQHDSASWTSRIHPDDATRVSDGIHAVIDGDTDEWSDEYRFQRSDGSFATVTDRGSVIRDPRGRAVRMVGGMRDVTEQRMLQEQLRQGQRLEALGRLTGGVAHDFNNLLTVILGNAELLRDDLADAPEQLELAAMTADAAQRGAALTRRLLAFARRQPLAPRPVDVTALVRGMEPLLRRTIGHHISVSHVVGGDTCTAQVDASQLEVALLNLVINSRDAMPDGGRLEILTAEVTVTEGGGGPHLPAGPGDHVLVSVTDNGAGILPEHVGRVFDPFFTTKETGAGSGLGLSMVYGFVTQSDGHVTVSSTPGAGTTVRMYLPRADAAAVEDDEAAPDVPARGTETVLVVDDDRLVRRNVADQVAALGYRVLVARDGPEALRTLALHDVDLLFSDVSMPGMTGRELATTACARHPGLRVLLTSGYAPTDPDVPGPELLVKPYRHDELARRLRSVLDR